MPLASCLNASPTPAPPKDWPGSHSRPNRCAAVATSPPPPVCVPYPVCADGPYTLTDHVESIVAARMRAPGGPTDVGLVLNNAPCDYDYLSCNRILRHIIPDGARITVYVKDANEPSGARKLKTYHGTGKGTAP